MDRTNLKDIKAVLKSLIVSCPHGLTIEQLNKDYQKMEGERIPYARLGFQQLEPFLRSLTDTLVVQGSGFSAKVTATQVDKIQHIDKMVSLQKKSTTDRKRQTAIREFNISSASATKTQNVPSYSRPPLLHSPPIISSPSPPVPPLLLNNMYSASAQSHYQSGPVYYNNYGNYNRRYTPPQPFYHPIPEVNAQYWVRQQQQQYLSEYNIRRQQQQLHWLFENCNQLQKLYANENSVQEKFNDLNITRKAKSNQQDTIKSTQNNVDQSQSINENLNSQKNSPLDENLNTESTSKNDESKYNWESTENHTEISQNDNNVSRSYQSKLQHQEQQKEQMWRTQNNIEQTQSIDGNLNYQEDSLLDENLNKEFTSKNNEVNYNWEGSENHGETCKTGFTRTSENDNNESRFYQSKSQQQQEQNVQTWRRRTNENHVNNVTEEEKNNHIKFTIRNSNLANRQIQNLFAEYDGLDGNQTDDMRSQISNNSNSTAIQSSSLGGISSVSSGRFKKSFVEINSTAAAAAAAVKELGTDLSKKEEEKNVKQLSKSCEKELPKQQEKPKDVKKKTRKISDSEAIPELAQNDIVFLLDFPPNSVKFGEKIAPSEIPSNIVKEAWFGLFIIEVNNPYKFWFHLFKEEHELDILMQDIENFYESLPTNELQISPSNIKAGQICAAPFGSNGEVYWHRAEILDNPDGQYVKVFFVDYGTVANVNISSIKYLLHEFSTLPSQALRGCLAYIKPIGHRWTRDATISFLDMILNDRFEKFLYAKATEIDYKDRVVHMIVTDTNDEQDFQINDALIRKGHARLCKEAYFEGIQNQKTSSTTRHFQQKYPTFDMLERGEYPSFHEIGLLLARGIDFEAREDESILPDIDENNSIKQFTKELINFTILRESDDEDNKGDEDEDEEEEHEDEEEKSKAINDDKLYLLDNISNNSNDSHYFVRSFRSSSISSSKSQTQTSVIEREKPEIKTNSIDKDEIISSNTFLLQNNNPFIQNKNPFLSSKSSSSCCSPSVYNSSKDESTETEVEKKDVSAQCDISNDNNDMNATVATVPPNFDNCTANVKQQLQQYPINMSQQFDLYISPGNNISQSPYISSGAVHSNLPTQLSGVIPSVYNGITPHNQLQQVPQQIINYSTAGATASGWQQPPPYIYNSGSPYCPPPPPSFNNNINPLFSQTSSIPAPNRIFSNSTGLRIPPGFEGQVLNRAMPPEYNVNYFKNQ